MIVPMLQRSGTAAEWLQANPVLEDGEVGFERDTNSLKVGNGALAWMDLEYFYSTSSIIPLIEQVVADLVGSGGGGGGGGGDGTPTEIDGGDPSDTSTGLVDGGDPATAGTDLIDGGDPGTTTTLPPVDPPAEMDGGDPSGVTSGVTDGGGPISTADNLPDGPNIDGGTP